jgi:hypothetical protein
MDDTKRRIERIIETDLVTKKGLQRGIINTRALARYIQDTEGLDTTTDAILGIIRRYPVTDGEQSGINRVLGGCELSMRNRVANFEIEYQPDRPNRHPRPGGNRRTTRGENVKLILGDGVVKVIADQKALEKFLTEIQPGEVVKYSTDLAEITLRVPPGATDTRGLTAKITAELVLNDIDLWGITCFYWHHAKGETPHDSPPANGEGVRELMLLVAEADGPRTIDALQRMLKENGVNSPGNISWLNRSLRHGRLNTQTHRLNKTRVTPTN